MRRALILLAAAIILTTAITVAAGSASTGRALAVTWSGTLAGNGVVAGEQTCSGTWQGNLTLSVAGTTVTGSGSVDVGNPACSQKLGTPDLDHVDFTLTGTKDSTSSGDTRFTLFLHGQSVSPSGAFYDPSGFLSHFGSTNEGIPLVLTATGARIDQKITNTVPLSNATVTVNDHFALKLNCDPSLLLKSNSEFTRADILFGEADTRFFKSQAEYDEWLADEEKEFAGISGEKAGLIQIVEGIGTKVGLEKTTEKVVNFFEYSVAPALTGYWIVHDVLPHTLDHDADIKDVNGLTDEGARTAKQAVADLNDELEQEPACQELAKAQRAKEDLAARKRALVDSWEMTPDNLYWNPQRKEWESEDAALKAAEEILTGARKVQGLTTSSRPPSAKTVRVTTEQAKAALRYVVKALTLQRDAMSRQRRAQTRTKTFTKAMQKLLRAG